MADENLKRAYETLTEVLTDHGVNVVGPDQQIDFARLFASESEAIRFGASLRSRGYNIGPAVFIRLHREAKVVTVRNLTYALAGNDDTEGHD